MTYDLPGLREALAKATPGDIAESIRLLNLGKPLIANCCLSFGIVCGHRMEGGKAVIEIDPNTELRPEWHAKGAFMQKIVAAWSATLASVDPAFQTASLLDDAAIGRAVRAAAERDGEHFGKLVHAIRIGVDERQTFGDIAQAAARAIIAKQGREVSGPDDVAGLVERLRHTAGDRARASAGGAVVS